MDWMGILALVVGPGGLIIALIERTRRENNRDHARNSQILHSIDQKVDKIDSRIDKHIEWHLDRE